MTHRGIASIVCLVIGTAGGCSSGRDLNRASSQLHYGIEAARMNLWREARFRFERAVQIDPSNAIAHNNLAVALEGTGEFERARAEYTEALRLERANRHIQKNYSRFFEFYSRNRKQERKSEPAPPPSQDAAPAPGAAAGQETSEPTTTTSDPEER